MRVNKFVHWLMAFAMVVISCAPSFACCEDKSAQPATQVETQATCTEVAGDCSCSGKSLCAAGCDKCKDVIEVIETIKMSVKDTCCSENESDECTVAVDREVCRIIYVPPSGPVRQCFKTHEDVKGKRDTAKDCCQVTVDGRQYCVKKGGSIFIPGLLPGDKGTNASSLTIVTRRLEKPTFFVDGKPQSTIETIIFESPCFSCKKLSDGDACTVEVTRQQCTWVGGGPNQPPQRVCWTTRENVNGKKNGKCCQVTVDNRQYCVEDGGSIYVPGIK